jgi:hypothetical protein
MDKPQRCKVLQQGIAVLLTSVRIQRMSRLIDDHTKRPMTPNLKPSRENPTTSYEFVIDLERSFPNNLKQMLPICNATQLALVSHSELFTCPLKINTRAVSYEPASHNQHHESNSRRFSRLVFFFFSFRFFTFFTVHSSLFSLVLTLKKNILDSSLINILHGIPSRKVEVEDANGKRRSKSGHQRWW